MKRIYHKWNKWECYPAGFYESRPVGPYDPSMCESLYAEFLSNEIRFKDALEQVTTKWKHSCEHYLTNENMNRIAWLGQASVCYAMGIPSCYRGGFNLLSEDEKSRANAIALEYLNKWLNSNGYESVDAETVKSRTKANLY